MPWGRNRWEARIGRPWAQSAETGIVRTSRPAPWPCSTRTRTSCREGRRSGVHAVRKDSIRVRSSSCRCSAANPAAPAWRRAAHRQLPIACRSSPQRHDGATVEVRCVFRDISAGIIPDSPADSTGIRSPPHVAAAPGPHSPREISSSRETRWRGCVRGVISIVKGWPQNAM